MTLPLKEKRDEPRRHEGHEENSSAKANRLSSWDAIPPSGDVASVEFIKLMEKLRSNDPFKKVWIFHFFRRN